MIVLTNEMIMEDIRAYQERIDKATNALNELPVEAFGWKQEKELNRKRRILLDEIRHVKNLIKIAEEALTDED